MDHHTRHRLENGKATLDDCLQALRKVQALERENSVLMGQAIRLIDSPEKDEQVAILLDGVIGAVEANSFEKMELWREYHQELKKTWVDSSGGPIVTIGYVVDRPICVLLMVSVVDGHKILFYEVTSQVSDHAMVDEWLRRVMPRTGFRSNGAYVNKADPMNFSNIFR